MGSGGGGRYGQPERHPAEAGKAAGGVGVADHAIFPEQRQFSYSLY